MITDKTRGFINKAMEVHGDAYDYSLVNYKNARENIRIICKQHGEYNVTPNSHLSKKTGCPMCTKLRLSNMFRNTKEEFINKAIEVHGNKYDYGKVEYVNCRTKVIIICNEHGEFEQAPNNHLTGYGCNDCGILRTINKLCDTKESFIEKANKIHNNKYDYSNVKYINAHKKVKIICNTHGEFEQKPNNHLVGDQGCPKCGIIYQTTLMRMTTEEFIEKSKMVHNDKYDYTNTHYGESQKDKVIILCKIHGQFEQTPTSHLRGSGCKQCGTVEISNKLRYTTAEFIERANQIHNYKYDYSKVNYITQSIKVTIICKEHGEFSQLPSNHVRGANCIQCAIKTHGHYSNKCIEYLDFMQIYHNNIIAHALNGGEFLIPSTKFRADGYCKETNTIYEFHGDYWHGNPLRFNPNEINKTNKCTFGELYQKTLEREQQIRDFGFNLITIWESDWVKLNKCVKTLQKKFRTRKLH